MRPQERGNNSRNVSNPMFFLQRRPDLVRQLARDLDGVDAGAVLVQALPLRNPAPARVRERDEALEDLGRAALDSFGVVLEVEEVFAVRAAF
jgi:hypothetical protein